MSGSRAVSRWAWAPWTDKKGRFDRFRAVTFCLMLLPGLWLAVRYALHMLGPRALNELIHGTGYWTIWFLLCSLMLTPAKAVLGNPRLVVIRRMVGNTALAYVLVHFTLYIIDQKWDLVRVATEIALRLYLTIGFVALLGLSVLGATSTDGWARRLGKRWKRLHRIVYGIALLGCTHYFIQSKADVSLPVLAAGIYFWLMLWRILPAGPDRKPVVLVGLTLGAAVLTAATEWGWYNFATHINAMRVLRSELDFSFGLHPVGQVLALGAAVILVLQLRAAAQGRAGAHPAFWAALFAAGAWVDDAVGFVFALDWGQDWESAYWLWQNLAWMTVLAGIGLAHWRLRDTGTRSWVDAVALACVLAQALLAEFSGPSLETAGAAAVALACAAVVRSFLTGNRFASRPSPAARLR